MIFSISMVIGAILFQPTNSALESVLLYKYPQLFLFVNIAFFHFILLYLFRIFDMIGARVVAIPISPWSFG